jgi:hypothetical protein
MDWKQQLKIQCDLASQVEVAKILGVSSTLINDVLRNKNFSRKTKLEALVKEKFPASKAPKINEDIDWESKLKRFCKEYTVPAIAKILGVSNSLLYDFCGGRYEEKKKNSKLKNLVLIRLCLDGDLDGISPRRAVRISKTDRLILGLIDVIFCADLISYHSLREKFDKYVLSRTLNYLIAKKLIAVVMREKEFFKHGRPGDTRLFKLACNCASPGLDDGCGDCPLGQEIMRIEGGYLALEEELEDAC